MKTKNKIVICDGGDFPAISKICSQYACGIEVQGFYKLFSEQEIQAAEVAIAAPLSIFTPRFLHAPFCDLCPGSCDPLVRAVARQRYQRACATATRLGMSGVIFHHGYAPNTSSFDQWIKRSKDFWLDLHEETGAKLHFYIENLLERSPELLGDLIRQMDHPQIGACLDVGHAHAYSTTPVLNWIQTLGETIHYVHLHDNFGQKDDHLGLGQGTIPVEIMIGELVAKAPEAYWAIETNEQGIHASFAWLESHANRVGVVDEDERLQRLRRAGVISGRTGRIDLQKLGRPRALAGSGDLLSQALQKDREESRY